MTENEELALLVPDLPVLRPEWSPNVRLQLVFS